MAPVPNAHLTALEHFKSIVSKSLSLRHASTLLTTSHLQRRDDTSTIAHGTGITSPSSIPNTAVFVLFGLIGAGFVCTGIWFFFWARNGGFHFKEGDWEDYKSTVLRRKGPNGTTLSGATVSTDLGGGSIVGKKWKKYKDHDIESSLGTRSEMSETKKRGSREKGKKWRKTKNTALRGGGADSNTVVSDDGEPDEVVRAYRHEKPARVGGINRIADSSTFDGSTAADSSTVAGGGGDKDALLADRQHTPTNSPAKAKKNSMGIRQVQPSVQTKPKKMDSDRIKAEAKRLQEKGRAAGARRDFSYTVGDDASTASLDEERRARRERRGSRSPSKKIPGSWDGSDVGSDVTGTKSYHHPIPGLSSGATDYAEERRRARREAGYRRGRRDELSDSDH